MFASNPFESRAFFFSPKSVSDLWIPRFKKNPIYKTSEDKVAIHF